MLEIEKKYRLTEMQRADVLRRLEEVGARFGGDEFEENTLYQGGDLAGKPAVLRLRRTNKRAVLTYKERLPSESAIKRQIEHETEVAEPEATHQILISLGFAPALVYEKRRQTWHTANVEVVIDELPFGWFMEIEGAEIEILQVEQQLDIENLPAEIETYPSLAKQHGAQRDTIIEARFS